MLQYVGPGIVLFSKSTDEPASLLYIPLDGSTGPVQHFVGQKYFSYGYPVPYSWRSSSALVTQSSNIPSHIPDLVCFDYAEHKIDPDPTLLPNERHRFIPGPVVALTQTHTLLTQSDNSFAILNTETHTLQPTSIVFGPRNARMSCPRFCARDYLVDGIALLAGSSGNLFQYCAWTDVCIELGYPEATKESTYITNITTIPDSSTFLASASKRLFGYDLRVSYAPVFAFDMKYYSSNASTMYSEYGFASWNDSTYKIVAGKCVFITNTHCQRLDIRSGCEDASEWNLPSHMRPLWASSVANVPK